MAPIFIPSVVSVLVTVGFFGLLFALIFWITRRINKSISDRKIRRKLAAASMAGDQEK